MSATAPRHGGHDTDTAPWATSPWLTSPGATATAGSVGWPAAGGAPRVHVVTRPSILRIAAGVFLGLTLFTVAAVTAAVLLAGALGGLVSDRLAGDGIQISQQGQAQPGNG
jgi:hypothetical protein